MSDTTERPSDVEPYIWAFICAVFPEAPHLALASFNERHALETATALLESLQRERG